MRQRNKTQNESFKIIHVKEFEAILHADACSLIKLGIT